MVLVSTMHTFKTASGSMIERTETTDGYIYWVADEADYARKDGIWHYLGEDIKRYGEVCEQPKCETDYLTYITKK